MTEFRTLGGTYSYTNPSIKTSSKFPGLTDDEISRLELATSNFTGIQKSIIQQKIYQESIKKKEADQYNQQRQSAKNEIYQRSLQEKNIKKQNLEQSKIRLEDLADIVKSKYGLVPTADTEGVIKGLLKQANDQGVDLGLLNQYLDKGDMEFLYQMGLVEKDKLDIAKEGFLGPLVRTKGAIRGTISGAGDMVRQNRQQTAKDIKRILADPNKSAGDKYAQILLGEGLFNGVVGTLGSVFGGAIVGGYKGATTQNERAFMNTKVQGVVQKMLKNEKIGNIIEAYNSLDEYDKQELNDIISYALDAMDLAGLAALSTKPVKQGVKGAIKRGFNVIDDVGDTMGGAIMKKGDLIEDTIKKQITKNTIKKGDDAMADALKTTGRILQGDTKAQEVGFKVFANMDTKGVKTYADLSKKMTERGKGLMKQVDDELIKYTDTYNFWDNIVKQDIETANGIKEIVETPISDGINHLKELYENIGDKSSLAKIIGIEEKFTKKGLTLKEMNDLAREYSREFGSKAFNKMGDPKTTVSAELYESQRKAMKEFVRNKMPDDITKNLDIQYSYLKDTQRYVDQVLEKVNQLQQKLKQRNRIEKGASFVGDAINKLTGGGPKAFVSKFFPSNIGNKINNYVDIERELSKMLKKLDDLNIKIGKG